MPSREELGRRLKEARQAKGLTLKEVEHLSGVSMTHTSQIERGMTSPTVGALEKLARALDRTASFFVEDDPLDEVSLVAKENRSVIVNEKNGIRMESLTSGIAGSSLHFCFLHVTPILGEPPLQSHAGEEAIYVAKGILDVKVGEKKYRLRHGESIHFKTPL